MKNVNILALAVLALLVGCPGGNDPRHASNAPAAPGTPVPAAQLTLTLANEGFGSDLRELKLNVVGLDLRTRKGTWVPLALGAVSRTVDLLAGAPSPLLEGASLPPGDYDAIKFRLAPGHSFKYGTGTAEALEAPAEFIYPFKSLHLDQGAAGRYVLLFDAHHALGRTPSGSRAFDPQSFPGLRDQDHTGRLAGTLRDHDTNVPIAGAVVTAQVRFMPPPAIHYEICRSAVTGPDGTFTLDLLPLDESYRLVSLPESGPHPHDVAYTERLPLMEDHPAPLDRTFLARPMRERPGTLAVKGLPSFGEGRPTELIYLLKEIPGEFDRLSGHLVLAKLRTRNADHTFGPLSPGDYKVWFHALAKPAPGQPTQQLSRTVQVRKGETAILTNGR